VNERKAVSGVAVGSLTKPGIYPMTPIRTKMMPVIKAKYCPAFIIELPAV
jgi:hypothetical protein